MKPNLSFPLLVLFGVTRGMAGVGAGMLLADRIAKRRRKLFGTLLFGIGAASTVPLIATVIRRSRRREVGGVMEPMTEVYSPSMGTVDDDDIESPEQFEPQPMWP